MIVGFLSDAHGNVLGLNRCLDALRIAGADQIYFLGDSIGYMPDGDAVLSQLQACKATCIRGNHEEMLLGNLVFSDEQDAVYRIGDARQTLLPRWRPWIEEWPSRRDLLLDGARLLLVHGSPIDPIQGYVYPDSDLTAFAELPYDFVLLGHTHRPFKAAAGTVTMVNVGSCGLPRDVGNLAGCAIYDTRTRQVEILRVKFDAVRLVTTLGDRIDTSVADCLRRTASKPGTGRIVNV